MPMLQRACLVLGAVVALTSLAAAAPPRRATWMAANQKVSASVRGQLVSVDVDARILVIKERFMEVLPKVFRS